MATTNASFPTLYDLAKTTDPDGRISNVVEILEQRNPVLKTMVWQEGNLPTGHQFTMRTGLPGVSWRYLNQGIVATKSRTNQVTDTIGLLNTRSVIDCQLANLNGNSAAWRASQEAPFIAALQNELETGLFYHSTSTNPEKIMGLAPRFASTTGPYGGSQIVLADSGSSGGDATSMWLVCWGPDTVHGIVPKGSTAGFEMVDMNRQYVADGSGVAGQEFLAYVTEWNWKVGLCVKDPRAIARVGNIDTGNLTDDGATGSKLINAAIKAYHKIFRPGMGKCVWYCNRTVGTYLHLQAQARVSNSTLGMSDYLGNGVSVTTLLGYPVMESDAILSNEATIT